MNLNPAQPFPSWRHSVHHDGSATYVSNPAPHFGERVRFRLRVDMHAPVKEVYMRLSPDGEKQLVKMETHSLSPPCRWWQIELPVGQTVFHYRFIIVAADGVWFYNANGMNIHDPVDAFDFKLLVDVDLVDWLPGAVFYQIFPDRFANGDPSLDPSSDEFEYRGYRPCLCPWGSQPPKDIPDAMIFYGGDLPGIALRLDYLQDLGVNALYLNPVFTAPTSHKYDVIDYDHVDPHFGGDDALAALRRELDRRGMRCILDIVPNHVGYWHPWFQAARRDQSSLEASYFTFNEHPDDYESWLGVWLLPKLNYRSQSLRERIYSSQDAVFRRWLRAPYCADGWRVDVANMLARQGAIHLAEEVNRGIRQAVKQTRGDAYLMGENFHDATPQLQGDQFDGVMNYMGFLYPLLDWLRGYRQGAFRMDGEIASPVPWQTGALEAAWRERRSVIPWQVTLQQYNMLSSHDIPRILSHLGGSKVLNQVAVSILFTYPGVPGIYYGDEIGLLEDSVLKSRACMNWDKKSWDQDLFSFYKRLIDLRKRSPTLQSGGFQMLFTDDDFFAFQRETDSDRVLVAASRSAEPMLKSIPARDGGIPDGERFIGLLGGQEVTVSNGKVSLDLHGPGAEIWKQVR